MFKTAAILAVAPLALIAILNCTEPVEGAKSAAKLEGTLVVVNPPKGIATVINVETKKVLKELKTGQGPHEAVASPNGKWVAVSNYGVQGSPGGSLTIIELPKAEVVKTIDLGSYKAPHGIGWLDNERLICTSELTKNLVVVNVEKGVVERAMSTEQAGSHMLALSKDGKRAFSANIPAGNVTVFDAQTGKKLGDVATGERTEGITATPDGKYVWAGNLSGSVAVVEVATLKKVKEFPAQGLPIRLTASPDGKWVYASQPQTGEIIVYDASKIEEKSRIKLRGGSLPASADPVTVVIHPSGDYAFASLYGTGAVAILDLKKGEALGHVTLSPIADGLAYSNLVVKQ